MFQKRLFIEPYMNVNDPVECGLVFHQLIQDVFEERIPVSPSQAVSPLVVISIVIITVVHVIIIIVIVVIIIIIIIISSSSI